MTPHNLAIIAYDSCLASSVTLPAEMLSAACDVHRATRRSDPAQEQSSCGIFGRKRRIQCAGSILLGSEDHPKTLDKPELVILPAIWRNPTTVILRETYLIPLLQEWAEVGTRICAVGTSSGFLAEAGLLDNKVATTHWSQLERFQRRYPRVKFKPDFLITQSENIFCVSSVNSVADLVVYFIEELFDAETAKKVEANFSPEIRKPYSSSLFREGEFSRHSDEDIVRLQHWLHENFRQKVTAATLADMLGISTRSLNRRFRQSLETTPVEYVTRLKLQHARELLKHSNLTSHEIAMECGFNDASYFSARFKHDSGVSPMDYRAMVKAKLFTADHPA